MSKRAAKPMSPADAISEITSASGLDAAFGIPSERSDDDLAESLRDRGVEPTPEHLAELRSRTCPGLPSPREQPCRSHRKPNPRREAVLQRLLSAAARLREATQTAGAARRQLDTLRRSLPPAGEPPTPGIDPAQFQPDRRRWEQTREGMRVAETALDAAATTARRHDRRAASMAQVWSQVAWMRFVEHPEDGRLAELEAAAWVLVQATHTGRCPRRAPGDIRDRLKRWHLARTLHNHEENTRRRKQLPTSRRPRR